MHDCCVTAPCLPHTNAQWVKKSLLLHRSCRYRPQKSPDFGILVRERVASTVTIEKLMTFGFEVVDKGYECYKSCFNLLTTSRYANCAVLTVCARTCM